jgi:hypothetical protein
MPEPDWAAQLDQTLAATRDFAKAAAVFFKELVESGVPAEAAVLLTNGYISSLIIGSMNQSGEED